MANGQNIDIVINAIDEATATIRKIGGAIWRLPVQAEEAQKRIVWATEKINNSFKRNQETFGKMAVAGGVAFAGITAGINQTIQDASNLNNALTGLKSIVQGTGGDFEKAKKVIQNFTADGLVTTEEAATSLKNLIAKGFSLDQAEQMMIRFKDAAAFGRQASLGLGEAIASASEGIKNENSILVDNAGVTKNVSVMVEEYAKSLGIKASALDDAQKREAIYQGILKETTFQQWDAAKLSAEYSGQVAKLNAQKLQLSQTIGTIMMPAMQALYAAIVPVLTDIMNWVKENPKLAQTIIIATTAVAGITAAIGILGLAIPGIIAGFWAIATAAGALGTALLFLATNPIGIVITAIAALAAWAYYVYSHWSEIQPSLLAVWNQIKADISGAVNAAKDAVFWAFDAMMAKVTAVVDWLGNKVQVAMDYARSIYKSLEDAGGALYDATHTETGEFSLSGQRAMGGPVNAGEPYLVGERGPEIIIPGANSYVVPNKDIGGGGGMQISINIGTANVRSEDDIRSLARNVKEEILRDAQLFKLGIS